MGKKTKVGKARKDEFYKRAKDLGYRSRAAFKLLEINRKFQFLQKSRVCIDLCAAPGGWCQVAIQNMPVQSLVVGIDLVPIKPIHNVTTLTEDITTEKCRQMIKKELQTWKADVVLHDGAPNVGKNWQHDAFQQCQLTLQALKLACEFLNKGGIFVTKVFRSKDYEKLMWVFRQLFKRATATKPKASRNESAEIFVVCEKFLAPDKLDSKFFDIRHVFKDVDSQLQSVINLVHPEKLNKKAEGYEENNYTMTNKLNASQYITADNHLELLAACTQIVIDEDRILNLKVTTAEVKACCDDIKVLGKRDLRLLQNWRKKVRTALELGDEKRASGIEKMEVAEEKDEDIDSSEDDDEDVERQVQELHDAQKKDLKKKRKRVMKEKRKLRDKMGLKMIIPGDQIQQTDDMELFNLKNLKTDKDLKSAQTDDRFSEEESDDSESGYSDDEPLPGKCRKITSSYSRSDDKKHSLGKGVEDDEDDELDSSDPELSNSDDDGDNTLSGVKLKKIGNEDDDRNPLVVDFQSRESAASLKTDLWFNKEIFNDVDNLDERGRNDEEMSELEWESDGSHDEVEEDTTVQNKVTPLSGDYSNQKNKSSNKIVPTADEANDDSSEDDTKNDEDDDGDTSSSDEDNVHLDTKLSQSDKKSKRNNVEKDGFEIVPAQSVKKVVKLSPVELAVGEELIKSNKRRRELIEMSYNRYTHGEENLPGWFAQDEQRHSHKQLPVTKEQIQVYKDRQRAIDVNPIKKVAEATARKKKRMMKRLEKARKKAEAVTDALDVTDKEKMKQVKEIYKKAGLLKAQKKEVTYIVAKRGVGKRVSRPPGVKGQFRVVDPRMKKDNKAKKVALKKGKKGKQGKGKKHGRK